MLKWYLRKSGDPRNEAEIFAELCQCVRNPYGAVYALECEEELLAGWLCMYAHQGAQGRFLYVSQWCMKVACKESRTVTHVLFALMRDFATRTGCKSVLAETHRASTKYWELLRKIGFEVDHVGFILEV